MKGNGSKGKGGGGKGKGGGWGGGLISHLEVFLTIPDNIFSGLKCSPGEDYRRFQLRYSRIEWQMRARFAFQQLPP